MGLHRLRQRHRKEEWLCAGRHARFTGGCRDAAQCGTGRGLRTAPCDSPLVCRCRCARRRSGGERDLRRHAALHPHAVRVAGHCGGQAGLYRKAHGHGPWRVRAHSGGQRTQWRTGVRCLLPTRPAPLREGQATAGQRRDRYAAQRARDPAPATLGACHIAGLLADQPRDLRRRPVRRSRLAHPGPARPSAGTAERCQRPGQFAGRRVCGRGQRLDVLPNRNRCARHRALELLCVPAPR
ncbi:hypothetical protein G6F40_014751 [Rhizopus arrhizus]|nr:hypothetical protein G6F40_014751 [Rhizopus arrhizus]